MLNVKWAQSTTHFGVQDDIRIEKKHILLFCTLIYDFAIQINHIHAFR